MGPAKVVGAAVIVVEVRVEAPTRVVFLWKSTVARARADRRVERRDVAGCFRRAAAAGRVIVRAWWRLVVAVVATALHMCVFSF